MEARFTFISTDERRSTEHVECEKVHAEREYLDGQLWAGLVGEEARSMGARGTEIGLIAERVHWFRIKMAGREM